MKRFFFFFFFLFSPGCSRCVREEAESNASPLSPRWRELRCFRPRWPSQTSPLSEDSRWSPSSLFSTKWCRMNSQMWRPSCTLVIELFFVCVCVCFLKWPSCDIKFFFFILNVVFYAYYLTVYGSRWPLLNKSLNLELRTRVLSNHDSLVMEKRECTYLGMNRAYFVHVLFRWVFWWFHLCVKWNAKWQNSGWFLFKFNVLT